MKFVEVPDESVFLKFEANKPIRGILRGPEVTFLQHWVNGEPFICAENETCKLCQQGVKAKFTFKKNIIVKSDKDYVVKILQQGPSFYKKLEKLQKAGYEPIENYILVITREGEGLHTDYDIAIPPNGQVTPEIETRISHYSLHKLESDDGPKTSNSLDDIPF